MRLGRPTRAASLGKGSRKSEEDGEDQSGGGELHAEAKDRCEKGERVGGWVRQA